MYQQAENAIIGLHPQLEQFSDLSIPKITFVVNQIISSFYDTARSRFQLQRRKSVNGEEGITLICQIN